MRGAWRKANWALIAAAAVFLVYFADILAAKLQIAAGNSVPFHIGDIGQFLLLLAAVVLFVIGTLQQEREEEQQIRDEPEAGRKSRRPSGRK